MNIYFSAKKPLEEILKNLYKSKMFDFCYDMLVGMNLTFHEVDDNDGLDYDYELEVRMWEDNTDVLPVFYTCASEEEINKIRATLIKVYGGSIYYDANGEEQILIKSNVFKNATDYSLGFMEVVNDRDESSMEETISAQIDLDDNLNDDNYLMCVIGKATPPLAIVSN